MLKDEHSAMSKADFNLLASNTEYYSGSDLAALCKEAAMGPVRELGPRIANVSAGKVRPIDMRDFRKALRNMKPSLSAQDLRHYEEFNEQYGSAGVIVVIPNMLRYASCPVKDVIVTYPHVVLRPIAVYEGLYPDSHPGLDGRREKDCLRRNARARNAGQSMCSAGDERFEISGFER
eukprot:scaffold1411_cov396-Prasinococcus_capsulatus_cf.AAC.3